MKCPRVQLLGLQRMPHAYNQKMMLMKKTYITGSNCRNESVFCLASLPKISGHRSRHRTSTPEIPRRAFSREICDGMHSSLITTSRSATLMFNPRVALRRMASSYMSLPRAVASSRHRRFTCRSRASPGRSTTSCRQNLGTSCLSLSQGGRNANRGNRYHNSME